MSLKLKIKKGDKVVVLSGEDKGKTGEVVKAMPKEGKVVVQGINLVKRHTKPSQTTPGGIVTKEARSMFPMSPLLPVTARPPKSAIRKRTEEKSASLAGPVK